MVAVLNCGVRIRPMGRHDLAAVGEIEKRSYPYPWSRGIFADCMRIGYCCRVAESGGEIRAYAVLSTVAGEAHLLNLCVAPEARGAGLGREMLDAVLVEARLHGAARLFLEVRPSNQVARALYRTHGFRVIGRRPDYYPAPDGREDALIMVLQLDSGS